MRLFRKNFDYLCAIESQKGGKKDENNRYDLAFCFVGLVGIGRKDL